MKGRHLKSGDYTWGILPEDTNECNRQRNVSHRNRNTYFRYIWHIDEEKEPEDTKIIPSELIPSLEKNWRRGRKSLLRGGGATIFFNNLTIGPTSIEICRNMFTVHCTQNTVHCTLYTVHCTLGWFLGPHFGNLWEATFFLTPPDPKKNSVKKNKFKKVCLPWPLDLTFFKKI